MEILLKYFNGLSAEQVDQFFKLRQLYSGWNEKINVISRKDISELYERHVLHSLSIAKIFSFIKGTKILDVGTGGGFPGIPLAIYFPDAEFCLVDSIGKKIKVVEAVAKELGLKNVTAENKRAEEVKGFFDFVVSRAVCAFPDFVALARGKVSPIQKNDGRNGILYLKGGDFEEEVKPFGDKATVYELSGFFEEEFFSTKKLIYLKV